MSNLAILSIENKIAQNINKEILIVKFANAKARKENFATFLRSSKVNKVLTLVSESVLTLINHPMWEARELTLINHPMWEARALTLINHPMWEARELNKKTVDDRV